MTKELAGLALREAVAVKVFGREVFHVNDEVVLGRVGSVLQPAPHYESDISAAWLVGLEASAKNPEAFERELAKLLTGNPEWYDTSQGPGVDGCLLAELFREEAPTLICRAALAALGAA